MANHYYGVTIPQSSATPSDISTGTSTTSKNVELVVLDGVTGRSKLELIKALEQFINYIATHDAPV